MKREFILACLFVLVAAVPAMADTVLVYREGQLVDPQAVRQILSQEPSPTAMRTRSIRLLQDAPSSSADQPRQARTRPVQTTHESGRQAKAVSLPVQFAFDSTEVLPAARAQLDALAAGIKLLPAQRRVVIEGHTDATGSDDYNLELSRRRAGAVKAYLVREHGIDAQRLLESGHGERQPMPGVDPYAGENRRVQFHGA